jgi:hypothetical protein
MWRIAKMKKHVLFAFGVSALFAGTPFVSAQAPAQTPSTSPSTYPSAQSSSSPQTVTGCLTPSADGKSFTLTEISAPGAASTSASAPKTWTVVSSGDVDLTKYVNHKVEITGESKAGMSDPSSSSTSSSGSSSASSAAATSGPKLQVKSVKDISNTCS